METVINILAVLCVIGYYQVRDWMMQKRIAALEKSVAHLQIAEYQRVMEQRRSEP